jgi:hypothetical protein
MPQVSLRLFPLPASPPQAGTQPGSPYTAVAEDLTWAEAEESLDSLEGQGVRSRVVSLNLAGRVSVWWAAA